jgi:exosortase family protein XrtF
MAIPFCFACSLSLESFKKQYKLRMKKYFIHYKPFLIFIGTFFLAYSILIILYQGYLSSFGENKLDAITKTVAKNTGQVLQWIDATSTIEEVGPQMDLTIFYHQVAVARIVEGCNAISIIILFVSFVLAFSGKLKPTLLFVFGGSLLIYVLNVWRIAMLCVLLFHFPEQQQLLHGVLFPLIIYGIVFILWLIWVRKFSRYASKTTK